MASQDEQSPRLALPRERRIRRSAEFEQVYQASVRHKAGPLLISAMPNDFGYSRLGMAVPTSVGSAVVRNKIRRRLREAFRLSQHDSPKGYDVVIGVRPHEVLKAAEYQQLLRDAIHALHQKWTRKHAKADPPSPPDR